LGGRVLIYGASGYTGRLIAARMVSSRSTAIVCGRTPDRVQALANELGVSARVCGIDQPHALDEALRNIDAWKGTVVHFRGGSYDKKWLNRAGIEWRAERGDTWRAGRRR